MTPPIYRSDSAEKPPPQDRIESGASGHGEPLSLSRIREDPFGVLEELARTGVEPPSAQHRLLDEVDLISSVSGGRFTAAYYALWGDRIFSDFEPQFLKKRVQNALRLRILAPWNTVRLFSPTFNRSDLAARPGAPFLIINSTDLTVGVAL